VAHGLLKDELSLCATMMCLASDVIPCHWCVMSG